MKNSILAILCFSVLACCKNIKSEIATEKQNQLPPNELLGSWDIREVHWISSDTTVTIKKAQPGIFMLTPERYSIIWTPTRQPRAAFNILSKPTDDEIKSGFGTIVFNSGTYQMTDSTITTQAILAKVPGFEGGLQFYDYSFENDLLILTMYDETYPDGNKPDWAGKWKTRFILEKVIKQSHQGQTS